MPPKPSKLTVRLGDEKYVINKPNRGDFEKLKKSLQQRRSDEIESFLRTAIETGESLAPSAQEKFYDSAFARAAKMNVVPIEEAIDWAGTIEGSARLFEITLARQCPDRKLSCESILEEILSMSPAEQDRMVSLGDGTDPPPDQSPVSDK